MRGNHAKRNAELAALGSIPACAGEPTIGEVVHGFQRVYPRVCGGTIIPLWMELIPVGLSPRVRGNLIRSLLYGAPGGSIPACAGEPGRRLAIRQASWVYPRVCGGTAHTSTNNQPSTGLSPRVRGNR